VFYRICWCIEKKITVTKIGCAGTVFLFMTAHDSLCNSHPFFVYNATENGERALITFFRLIMLHLPELIGKKGILALH
jgi:hypothetical protein